MPDLHPKLDDPEDVQALDTGEDDDTAQLDEEDFLLDDEGRALPEITDLPSSNPSDPDEDDFAQDDGDESELEGLGSSSDFVTHRAVLRVIAKVKNHTHNAVGYCLKEIRTVNEVGSRYMCAKDSMQAAPQKHRVHDWDLVPRGSIVYFSSASTRYGHITEALGQGYVGSTDWPTGRWGKVHGHTIQSAWGYTVAYWSPYVNNTRVWWPLAYRKRHKHH